MKRLLLMLMVLMLCNCTWGNNVQNETARSARLAVIAANGYQELYEQSLLTTNLLKTTGKITNDGARHLVNLGNEAQATSKKVAVNVEGITFGTIGSEMAEKYIIELQQKVMMMSSAVRAFLANEGILERKGVK